MFESSRPAFAHGGGGIPGQNSSATALHNELVACAVVATIALLRPKRASQHSGLQLFTPSATLMRVVRALTGLIALAIAAGILFLAVMGTSRDPFGLAENSATLFVVGMVLLCAVIGNLWALFAPWLALSLDPWKAEAPQKGSVQAATLFVFYVVWLCDPNSKNAATIAWTLAVYLLALFAIRSFKGVEACAAIDPFMGLFGVMAKISPIQTATDGSVRLGWPFRALTEDRPITAYAPAFVLAASVLFEGLGNQTWWQTWSTASNDSTVFFKRLLGFVVVTAVLGAVVLTTSLVAAHFSRKSIGQTLGWIAPALVPLSLGFLLAQDLFAVAQVMQDQLFVIWDPFNRGWRPLGAAHQGVSVDLVSSYLGRVQTVALLLGPVVGMAVARQRVQRITTSPAVTLAVFAGVGVIGFSAISLMIPS